MQSVEDLPNFQQGVGATAEVRLVSLAPLIDYYAREMGELPGRLMIAISFLGDVQLMPSWATQPPEFRQAIEQAQALVVSTMIRLLNEQKGCSCGDDNSLAAEMQRLLDDLSPREQR
jgi:hypothetical protein